MLGGEGAACIIHLIRNTFRLASRKYWDQLKHDVKPIYTAINATAARVALDDLSEKWGARYPAIIRLWNNAWDRSVDEAATAFHALRGPSGTRDPLRLSR